MLCIVLLYYLKVSDLVVLSKISSLFNFVLFSRKWVAGRYKLFNDILDNNLWLKFLRGNVDELYTELKKEFVESLFRLRVKASIPLVIRRVSIFSVCEHMFNCVRNCDDRKDYCSTCSTVEVLRSDDLKNFENIVIDERDFPKRFLRFFVTKSLFSLGLFDTHSFWISRRFRCVRFEEQKKPMNLFIYFLLCSGFVLILFLKLT